MKANDNKILFYRVRDAYGAFSNFAPFPLKLDGLIWPTSEHYFQAQKFLSEDYRESIRLTKTAIEAAQLGRDRERPIREDWESIKDSIMYKAVKAKFTQHPEIAKLLMGTGDALLVEHTERDSYWGDGGNGTGKNKLGEILMIVRKELRNVPSNSSS